jgi:hypothetical protein
MRVDPDRGVDERIFLGESECGCVRVSGDFAVAYTNDCLNSGIERTLNDGFAIGVKLFSLDVRVRIDVH